MKCRRCHNDVSPVSEAIGFCVDCLRSAFGEVEDEVRALHIQVRADDGLPGEIPQDRNGWRCPLCAHHCRIPEGRAGFCGVYRVLEGRRVSITGRHRTAVVRWYHDPLPTNCCAAWVCPGCSDTGYPHLSYAPGPEYGYKNLAVFYGACNFDCLFCQNWSYREELAKPVVHSIDDLADSVDRSTSCICFFGGDPGPQVIHALGAAREVIRRHKDRIVRICWETNGGVSEPFLDQMAKVSMASGGCIKVDLKAWSVGVHKALCGVGNGPTLRNVRRLAEYHRQRRDPPFLIASTLLVPGYVDVHEVRSLARFLVSVDSSIPYTLLAFHPEFRMRDLPPTSRVQALECVQAARDEGVANVHVGNVRLLW